jgi:hypothetical protein
VDTGRNALPGCFSFSRMRTQKSAKKRVLLALYWHFFAPVWTGEKSAYVGRGLGQIRGRGANFCPVFWLASNRPAAFVEHMVYWFMPQVTGIDRQERLCSICARSFAPNSRGDHDRCLPCWRLAQRGPRLKQLIIDFEKILQRGRSVLWCSVKLGVSEATIFNWRLGKTDPSAENVLALREFCVSQRFDVPHAM